MWNEMNKESWTKVYKQMNIQVILGQSWEKVNHGPAKLSINPMSLE